MYIQWARHKHLVDTYIKHYHNNPKPQPSQEKTYETERDILIKNHRFLRSEDDDQDLTWEKRIAKKYYDKLYKEYALVELKYYKEGRIAMRWRNESELFRGKGQFTCGNLRCDNSDGLQSWEVNFGYMEQGEKKNALVKIRLCEKCSIKLNYKKKQKRAISDHNESKSSSSKTYKSSERKRRRRSSDDRDSSRENDRRPDANHSDDDVTGPHKRHKKSLSDNIEDHESGLSSQPKTSLDKSDAFFRGLFE
ncbi:hypothetical protein BGZ49_006198 [Haplosporangium sp. Z 27]|nr:hypothetical protein BGZ49_006198 [Haplosporangium sp. Z 27]